MGPRSSHHAEAASVGRLLAAGIGIALCGCVAAPPGSEAPAHLRDSEAGGVVLRAIEAHGGWASWTKARAAEYMWESPGARPEDAPRRARVRFDLHGARVRIEDAGGGWVQAWDGREAWTEPAAAEAQLDAPARFITRTEHYWFSLPWKLADPGAHLELLEDEERGGKKYRRVRVTYEPGMGDSPQDWYIYYFNADSGLLERAVFAVTFFGLEPGQTEYPPYYGEWSDHVDAGGLKLATLRRFGPWNDGSPTEFPHADRLLELRVSGQPLPEETFQRAAAR